LVQGRASFGGKIQLPLRQHYRDRCGFVHWRFLAFILFNLVFFGFHGKGLAIEPDCTKCKQVCRPASYGQQCDGSDTQNGFLGNCRFIAPTGSCGLADTTIRSPYSSAFPVPYND
jgi:hypothetical protein